MSISSLAIEVYLNNFKIDANSRYQILGMERKPTQITAKKVGDYSSFDKKLFKSLIVMKTPYA